MSFMYRLFKKLSSGGGATVVPASTRSRSRSRMSQDERRHSPHQTTSVTKEPSPDGSDRELLQYHASQSQTNEAPKLIITENSESQANDFDRNITAASPQSRSSSSNRTSQGEFCCNECFQDILKFRYKCVECPDFDLCHDCEALGVHESHYMLRIPVSKSKSEAQIMIDSINRVFQSGESSQGSTSSYRTDNTDEPVPVIKNKKTLRTTSADLKNAKESSSSNSMSESSADEEVYVETFYKTQGVEVDIDNEMKQSNRNKLPVLEILEEANEEDSSSKERPEEYRVSSVKEEVRQEDDIAIPIENKITKKTHVNTTSKHTANLPSPTEDNLQKKEGFPNLCENVPKGLNVLWQRVSPMIHEISQLAHRLSDVQEVSKVNSENSEASDNSTTSQESTESIVHLLQERGEKTEIRDVVVTVSVEVDTKEVMQGTQTLVFVDNMPAEKSFEKREKTTAEQQTAFELETDKADWKTPVNGEKMPTEQPTGIDKADSKTPVNGNETQEAGIKLPNLTPCKGPCKDFRGKLSSQPTAKISLSRTGERLSKNIISVNTSAKKSIGKITPSIRESKTRNVTIRCAIEKNVNKSETGDVTEKKTDITTPNTAMKTTNENVSLNTSEKKSNASTIQNDTEKNTSENNHLTTTEDKTCNETQTVDIIEETLSQSKTLCDKDTQLSGKISPNPTEKNSRVNIPFTTGEETKNKNVALSVDEGTSVETRFVIATAEELTNKDIPLIDNVKKLGKPIPLSTLEDKSSINIPSISTTKNVSKDIPQSAMINQTNQNVTLNQEKSNNIMPLDNVEQQLSKEKSSMDSSPISTAENSIKNIQSEEKLYKILPLTAIEQELCKSSPFIITKKKSTKIRARSANDKKSSKKINPNATDKKKLPVSAKEKKFSNEDTPLSSTRKSKLITTIEKKSSKSIHPRGTEEKSSDKSISLSAKKKTSNKRIPVPTKKNPHEPSSAYEKKSSKNIPLSATEKKSNKNITLSSNEKKSNKNIPLSASEKKSSKNIPLSSTEKKSNNRISVSPTKEKSSSNLEHPSTSEEKSSKKSPKKKSPPTSRRQTIPPAFQTLKVEDMKKTSDVIDTATPSLDLTTPASRRRLNVMPVSRHQEGKRTNVIVLPKRWQDATAEVLPQNKSREKSKLKDNSADRTQSKPENSQGLTAKEHSKKKT